MEVTLTEVNQQSGIIEPRANDKNRDPKYFWRMTVTDDAGNPNAIFVSGLATDRGRNYHEMVGQKFDCTFSGGTVDDRDGSSWKKAKLDKPGQGGAQGGSGASHGGGGHQRSSGGGNGSSGGRKRYEMPRDDYFRRFWVLYFESATAALDQLAVWKADHAEIPVDQDRFWEQIGKVTNQAVMSIGLECLPQSGEQAKAIEDAARAKAEEEAAEQRRKEEEAARRRLEEEQKSKSEQMNW